MTVATCMQRATTYVLENEFVHSVQKLQRTVPSPYTMDRLAIQRRLWWKKEVWMGGEMRLQPERSLMSSLLGVRANKRVRL